MSLCTVQRCLNDKCCRDWWFNGALVYTESRHNYSELQRLSTHCSVHGKTRGSTKARYQHRAVSWGGIFVEPARRSATSWFGFIARAVLQRIVHERSMALFEMEHVVIYSDHDQASFWLWSDFDCNIQLHNQCRKNHGRNRGANKSHRLDINWLSRWQMWSPVGPVTIPGGFWWQMLAFAGAVISRWSQRGPRRWKLWWR